uniref:Uncharacterized protein n=1 Tax=Anguilla anguilla TaxID=7936 RepID=A0A0E9VYC1_ANGAN
MLSCTSIASNSQLGNHAFPLVPTAIKVECLISLVCSRSVGFGKQCRTVHSHWPIRMDAVGGLLRKF